MEHRPPAAAWRFLAASDADVALLQEAGEPPADAAAKLATDAAFWRTGQHCAWRAAIVNISNSAKLKWLTTTALPDVKSGELGVSRPGTLAAAIVTPCAGEPFVAVSAYAVWERSHNLANRDFIYADASVHRLISDLSVFAGKKFGQDILVAGDLNILHGYGEYGDAYWAARYETIFSRMTALGFRFVGPQAPNGRQAEPWPAELPRSSGNVPTYHTNRQAPSTCTRQLDFVFASPRLANRVQVTALNEPDQWGPSDHCRVEIRVD
ncbi:endonuclease/exonuclease/phosphatase family protein [Methyloceanibacter marginalis]|uniref:endonuclease/exonuclease/phosphatase family protein n=1 Tax=Methyloceanibacter marginalis TaxID=1774971 RepID=UPI0013017EE9|nr:endonuclease/exonuclease/phosphatase family protein [Methyloceanibacter marginalis]